MGNGRPLEFGYRLTETIQVNVSTSERELIEKECKELDITVSRYIRNKIFESKLTGGKK
jgi:predicted transcriptional regulator